MRRRSNESKKLLKVRKYNECSPKRVRRFRRDVRKGLMHTSDEMKFGTLDGLWNVSS